MNRMLIVGIFFAGQLLSQTGYFKNRHIVVSRKHCHHLKKVTSLEIRLDDIPVENEWILRRMDSGHKDESCPARPTKGLTFLQSSINPELFRLSQLHPRPELFLRRRPQQLADLQPSDVVEDVGVQPVQVEELGHPRLRDAVQVGEVRAPINHSGVQLALVLVGEGEHPADPREH